MYDAKTRRIVLLRLENGESLRGLSLSTGISRGTLREWQERGGAFAKKHNCRCPRCRSGPLPLRPYLYLLGQYLGDGLVSNPVHFVRKEGCTTVGCITEQWLHLLPQHGPGRKHTRKIELTDWQLDLVPTDPRPLIRGLIHSDGCRITNWTEKSVGGTVKRYTYPRYFFSNVSDDIRGIFTDALDLLGIAWKQNRWNTISVARREAVAALDEFVGPKT